MAHHRLNTLESIATDFYPKHTGLMDFNIFQILILLFIFYPLIKSLIEKMSGTQEQEEEEQQADPWYAEPDEAPESHPAHREPHPGERKKPESWEEFFEGLEDVLAGKDPGQRQQEASKPAEPPSTRDASSRPHPLDGPVYSQETSRPATSTTKDRDFGPASATRESLAARQAQFKKYEGRTLADEVSDELTDSDNPIYADLDEEIKVVVSEKKGMKNVRGILGNSKRLRDGILLKEILDPPKSLRRFH
ncbi:hypothetical protein QLX67_08950 [Balneolaceae bacterium ANBcel3]|nr:hypothetical protein [Balneolaceae bacterium ANBcel3]